MAAARVSEAPPPNIHDPVWEREMDMAPFGLKGTRVGAAAGATDIGTSVYEIAPGRRNLPFHAHHGIEELIVVLRGTPTLRTPDGERVMADGEVHACGRGTASAHQLINRTDEPVRVLIVSTRAPADFIEYPDSAKLAAMSGAFGSPDAFQATLSSEATLGYFDGELDPASD
jgi:uncharacterized cupin superfamily protein